MLNFIYEIDPWLKYDFEIKQGRGSEMPASFLFQNASDVFAILNDKWKIEQNQGEFCQIKTVSAKIFKSQNMLFRHLFTRS